MGRPPATRALKAFINGRLVGYLDRRTTGAITFQYDKTWLAWTHAFPISMSMPLQEDRYMGETVIAVFDNLLPDSEPIRRRLAERVGSQGYDAYSLLSAIGRDCVGALQFLPLDDEPGLVGKVAGRPIDDKEIADILNDLKGTPLGVDVDSDFRISLAGAQEKTALLFWQDQWQMPIGSTGTTHILKPAIGLLANGIDLTHSVENEHICMRITAAFGLPTARTEIREFAGKKTLVVERFDRIWTEDGRLLRCPQEDCCQALSVPPPRKYQSDGGPGMREILDLLKASDNPQADRVLFLKAQILFWLIGATDGHAKNFSIYLHPGGRFGLTPIYDVMSAQPNVDAGQITHSKFKLAMTVGTKRHYAIESIAPRHFHQTAYNCGMADELVKRTFDEIVESIDRVVRDVRANLPPEFPDAITTSIIDGMQRRVRLFNHSWVPRGGA